MPKADKMEPRKAEDLTKKWLAEIDDAMKREKKYRKLGKECVDLYEAKTPDTTPFAILYSNSEVLIPAVYNARPVPIVSRRYKDADPSGKAVAEVSTRMLKFLVDTENRDYDSYDDLMQPAVLDAVVTNRGLTRFRYVAKEGQIPECVYGEAVRWDKFFHGYARTWKKVPWIGFEWDMTKEELKKSFPDAAIDYTRLPETDDADDGETKSEDREELTGVRTFKVYEIWDKASEKVIFLSACCPKGPLRYIDDPLKLSGFFPVPRPLNFTRRITTLVPVPLYQHYRQQAAELNDLTRRLRAIIQAIKYRGAYNSTVEGIEKMLNAEDNELVPVENLQSMPDNTTIDKLIYTVPTNELAATAQALYGQREQCKQVIYEITGISDILRGASVASETATAQTIKNQWGSLRLKKMQKEVQRYCRESLAIMLEIAAANFEVATMRAMTGLPYFSEEEKQKVGEGIQQQKAQAQQAATAAQQAGQQPPPPPPVPPEVELMMKAPSWEKIDEILKNDVTMHYKTDIETNSTIDAEAAQDKQDIAELMNAISQFLNGIGPLVENGTMPMNVAKEMLLVVARRFNFGSQIEDALNAMKAPEPKEDPAEKEKAELAKIELQVATQEAQQKMAAMKMEAEIAAAEYQQKKELMVLEAQLAQANLQIKREELAIQQAGLAAKAALQRAQHDQKMAALAAKPKEPANAAV